MVMATFSKWKCQTLFAILQPLQMLRLRFAKIEDESLKHLH
jgi:hypothetical protein